MPTINRRVLSNLIELIKPYISESVVSLDNWRIRRGKYDGEGKFTVYPGEEDFKVGSGWYGDMMMPRGFRANAMFPMLAGRSSIST